MRTIAIFDLDQTLVPFDCNHAWGQHLLERGLDRGDFLVRQQAFMDQYNAGTLDIRAYLRFSMEATVSAGSTLAQQALADFVERFVKPRISPSVLELIDSHRQLGHHLLVITATNAFVSRAVVDVLGIDDLVANELATDEQGWFTGEMVGVPSFQGGKVTRFQSWLKTKAWERSAVEVYFYSDSINDLPLLAHANHPIATNPSAALRAHANHHGWPVLSLF